MKRIPKEIADKMVEDVLIALSKKKNVSREFAKDSLNIINNPIDNSVFTGILLTKARPTIFNNNEIDMKATIIGAINTVFLYAERIEDFKFNDDLAKEFSKDDQSKCAKSTKLDFALNQFVNAFFEYERLENEYPELMKIM
jgi:hypothetical protein